VWSLAYVSKQKESKVRHPEIEAAAKLAAEHAAKGGFEGKKNLYQCEHDPSHIIVTVDREPGVTQFMTVCERCKEAGTPGSRGMRHPSMTSAMYRVHQMLTPTHEWYRPDTFDGLNVGSIEHVKRGGLLLRPIEGVGSAAPPFREVCDRLFDMLLGDDGQAWSEAERFLKRHAPDLYQRIGMQKG